MEKINYAESLQSLMSTMFINYSGCLIEKVGNDFKHGGKTYPTLDLAKKAIDLNFQHLQNSINRNKLKS